MIPFQNPFLQGIGPAPIGGQPPAPLPMGWEQSQMDRSIEDARRMQLSQALAAGQQQNLGGMLQGVTRGVGMGLRESGISQAVTAPIKQGFSYVTSGVKSGLQGLYNSLGGGGEAVTTGTAAAAKEAPGLFSNLAGAAGKAASYAGAGYSAYGAVRGFQDAREAGKGFRSEIREDYLTDHERGRLERRYGEQAVQSAQAGGAQGAASGTSVAPGIGTILGYILGSLPGRAQELSAIQQGGEAREAVVREEGKSHLLSRAQDYVGDRLRKGKLF